MSKTKFIAKPGKQEVIVTHTFDAPRELVFKLATDSKYLPQWWGPKYLTTTIEKNDLREGGVWRYIQQDDKCNIYAFHGVYHLVKSPELLVYTFEFEGTPGHVTLDTVNFEEVGRKTKVTIQAVFQSVKDREGMLKIGMEQGEVESMNRLEELLVKMSSCKVA